MLIHDLLTLYATRHALSERSVAMFRATTDRFEKFLGRPASLDDFDDLALARFAEWRRDTNHYRGRQPRPATVKKDLAHLLSMWNHAAKKRMTRSNGMLIEYPDLPRGLVKVSLRPPRAYSVDEIDALVKTCRGRKGMVGPVPAWWHWETLLKTAWQTAERIGGLLATRWRDVDLEERRITFDGANRKGGTKTIVRSITPDLAEMLAMYRRGDDELVWPWCEHRHRKSLWQSLQIIGRLAGVKTHGFHSIRKASGSFVAAAGGDATDFLSHSDAKTTREHYLDRRIVGGADPLDLLPALPSERRTKPQPAPQPVAAPATSEPAQAGRRIGASLAARGLACPPRAQHDALAAAAGIDADDVADFSSGLIEGWIAGQGDAA